MKSQRHILRSRSFRRLRPGRFLREERGAASVWLAFAIVPLLAFVGVAVDVGLIAAARGQLKRGSDAGSHVGVKLMRDGRSNGQVLNAARTMTSANVTLSGVNVTPEIGTYDVPTGTFTAALTNSGAPAVRVRSQIPNLPLNVLPLIGLQNAQIQVESITIGKKREIVIVQDTSGSMGTTAMGQARNADTNFVNQMFNQGVHGDRVGLVSFSNNATVVRGLTFLTVGGRNSVNAGIAGLTASGGTNTAAGITAAVGLFQSQGSPTSEAEHVIILVSDGIPNNQQQARQAAQAAGAAGVHLFTVFFQTGGANGAAQLQQLIQRNYAGLAPRPGIGQAVNAQNGAQLNNILVAILNGLPIDRVL